MSLGTPLKHWALLTCALALPWPKTCSHLLKPWPQTLWYLWDQTSALVFAWAFGSLHTFEINGLQLKVGPAHSKWLIPEFHLTHLQAIRLCPWPTPLCIRMLHGLHLWRGGGGDVMVCPPVSPLASKASPWPLTSPNVLAHPWTFWFNLQPTWVIGSFPILSHKLQYVFLLYSDIFSLDVLHLHLITFWSLTPNLNFSYISLSCRLHPQPDI